MLMNSSLLVVLTCLSLTGCLVLAIALRRLSRSLQDECARRDEQPADRTENYSHLLRHETLLHAVLDHTDSAILALDVDLRITFANQRCCSMWSLSRNFLDSRPTLREVIVEMCRLGIYPEAEAEFIAERRLRILEATLDIVQLEIPRTDGIVIEGFATRLPDGGFLLTYRDVTGQVNAAEQLRKSQEHYRTLIETVPHGVIECDPQGRISYANQTCCAMWQTERDHLIGAELAELVAPALRRRLRRTFEQISVRQPLPSAVLLPSRTPQGVVVWRQLDWNYLRDNSGKLLGFIGVITDITTQKRFEAQLQDTNASLRQLFQAAPMAIINLDRNGRILHWNRRAAELLGWSESLACGQTLQQLSLPEGQHETLTTLLQAGYAGNNACAELLMLSKQGELFEISMVVGPLGGSGHHAAEVVAILDDIRDRKRMEQVIKNSAETYRNLVESAPVAIFVHVDGFLVFLNPAAVALFGATSPDELLGEEIRTFLHPDDQPSFVAALDKASSESFNTSRSSLRIQPLHGTQREVDSTFLGVDYNGCAARMAICIDVTERKTSEEALRRSEADYRRLSHEFETIFNGIPDSLTVWSHDRSLLWANRAAAMFFGSPPGELNGRNCSELCFYQECAGEQCEIRHCLMSGQLDEQMRKTRDGRTWGIKTFPLRDETGRVTRVIRLASDLSERVRLREEATRAAHLAALGELAAGVAHEVNNPTGLILLDLPALRDAFRDARPVLDEHFQRIGDFPFAGLKYSLMRDQLPAMFDEVIEGAQRIKHIVEELKDFSRPTDPQQFDLLDLNEVVAKAISLTGGQMRKFTDHFTVQFSPERTLVQGSVHRLEQVMINLLLNAGQSLPDRSRGVTVSVIQRTAARRNAIVIQDQGVGIAPDHLRQITDPFFTTRRETGGTGLGLSVSSRIVQEHNGTIHFDSEPEVGTTVTVELPLVETGN